MAVVLPPVQCIVEHHHDGGMMTLTPAIESNGRTQGTYQLEIVSNSEGNSSTNIQGGDFEKTDPGRLALSRSTISASLNGWTARLTVYGPEGQKLCIVSVP